MIFHKIEQDNCFFVQLHVHVIANETISAARKIVALQHFAGFWTNLGNLHVHISHMISVQMMDIIVEHIIGIARIC